MDLTTIATLEQTAASAVATFQNDGNTVAADQAKIKAAQDQLAADQATLVTDGAAAYSAVQAVVTAWQEVLGSLPAPSPAVTPST